MKRLFDACCRAGHDHRRAKLKIAGGYSLLEVILALAVLAGSGLAIQALIADGSRAGMRAEQGAEALFLAQSLLDELAMDASQMDGERNGVFPQQPAWEFRAHLARSESLENWGIAVLTVEVFPAGSRSLHAAREAATVKSARGCRLTRWVRRSASARVSDPSAATAGHADAAGGSAEGSPFANGLGGAP
ncbi:MAG: hypothetical protein FJ295_04510 [Planctomycetes bacterium]|nr:hypothetical protein [Planctomycetota bacterium]